MRKARAGGNRPGAVATPGGEWPPVGRVYHAGMRVHPYTNGVTWHVRDGHQAQAMVPSW
jgi:hypothetical protein